MYALASAPWHRIERACLPARSSHLSELAETGGRSPSSPRAPIWTRGGRAPAIAKALESTTEVGETAKVLGYSRVTLWRRLRDLGLRCPTGERRPPRPCRPRGLCFNPVSPRVAARIVKHSFRFSEQVGHFPSPCRPQSLLPRHGHRAGRAGEVSKIDLSVAKTTKNEKLTIVVTTRRPAALLAGTTLLRYPSYVQPLASPRIRGRLTALR